MKSAVLSLLLTIYAVNVVNSEINNEVPAQKTNQQIPSWLIHNIMPDFNATGDVPPVKDGELSLKKMCEANGGKDSYEAVVKAKDELQQCFSNLKTFTELPKKVEDASPHGDIDLVFMEYCNHSVSLKGCINKFLFTLEPCLAENEKSSKYILQNITESIFGFICEGQGNNIAVFYTEQGLQCIMSRKVGIQKCLNETVAPQTDNSTERDSLFGISFDLEQCKTVVKLRKCLTNELMMCPRTTAANVVDSIFELIHRSSPCLNFSKEGLLDDSSNGLRYHYVAISVLLPIITIILARNFK